MEEKIWVRISWGIDFHTKAAFAVRHAVFVEEQGIAEEIERDEDDRTALHAVLYLNEQAVAAGRAVVNEHIAKIGRMAVLAAYRNRGLGKQILDALEEAAKEKHATVFELSAQRPAVNFYFRSGYKTIGEEYKEAGLPHIKMKKERF